MKRHDETPAQAEMRKWQEAVHAADVSKIERGSERPPADCPHALAHPRF